MSDTPTYSDRWTGRSHLGSTSRCHGGSRRRRTSASSNDNSRARLEGEASREIRETFGKDFARQLEEEQDVIRSVHAEKARIGREAGCPPTSPLSSSSTSTLSSLGALGLQDDRRNEADGERAGGDGESDRGVGGPMADWLN